MEWFAVYSNFFSADFSDPPRPTHDFLTIFAWVLASGLPLTATPRVPAYRRTSAEWGIFDTPFLCCCYLSFLFFPFARYPFAQPQHISPFYVSLLLTTWNQCLWLHSELTPPLGSFQRARIAPNVSSCSLLLIPPIRNVTHPRLMLGLFLCAPVPYPHAPTIHFSLPVLLFPEYCCSCHTNALVVSNRSPWLDRCRIKPMPPSPLPETAYIAPSPGSTYLSILNQSLLSSVRLWPYHHSLSLSPGIPSVTPTRMRTDG